MRLRRGQPHLHRIGRVCRGATFVELNGSSYVISAGQLDQNDTVENGGTITVSGFNAESFSATVFAGGTFAGRATLDIHLAPSMLGYRAEATVSRAAPDGLLG